LTAIGYEKLRFGIMCFGYHFPAWEAECIKRLIASGYAEPVLLIRDISKRQQELWYKKLFRRDFLADEFDTWWLRKRAQALKSTDMSAHLQDLDVLDCNVVLKGRFSQYFTNEDVATIKSYQLTFPYRGFFQATQGIPADTS
jgi:hypothetical protein